MKKTIDIEGMSCNHCKMHVEQALSGLNGVTNAVVDLKGKNAVVTAEPKVTDEALKNAVEEGGYKVTIIR